MVFLDTCVWIELLCVKTPEKSYEIRQAELASDLLEELIEKSEEIVTIKEQLLEVISVVQKIKLKEYSRKMKSEGLTGCSNLKEFRSRLDEFIHTKNLCKHIVDDIKYFAKLKNSDYSIETILERLDLADMNDCIYYDFCKNENINLYTFDKDIEHLGEDSIINVLC